MPPNGYRSVTLPDHLADSLDRLADYWDTTPTHVVEELLKTDAQHGHRMHPWFAEKERDRIRELVEAWDLEYDGEGVRYDAEILDHTDRIEENGLELTEREEWTPDPDTPAELVAWDFGLMYGYYTALSGTADRPEPPEDEGDD